MDSILDTAGQKGTGKWTSVTALDLGVPLTLISEAVFARCLSAIKDERVAASKLLRGPDGARSRATKAAFLDDLEKALYASQDLLLRAGLRAHARRRRPSTAGT